MMTLRQLAAKPEVIPATTAWYLADLGEARGKQELFTRQSPQKLKVLREHALIESAVSSNRIEGVEVDQARIATIIFGKPVLRERNEEEVQGYIDRSAGRFRIADIQKECAGVSIDLIRWVLKNLRSSGQVECLGRGQNAEWRKTDQWEMGNTQSNRERIG
ncbi:MAG: hypothetical protein HY314_06250 [Acidobacteria bacterium]|nr:hypothetical protein [Acidobacteriota bacterium]